MSRRSQFLRGSFHWSLISRCRIPLIRFLLRYCIRLSWGRLCWLIRIALRHCIVLVAVVHIWFCGSPCSTIVYRAHRCIDSPVRFHLLHPPEAKCECTENQNTEWYSDSKTDFRAQIWAACGFGIGGGTRGGVCYRGVGRHFSGCEVCDEGVVARFEWCSCWTKGEIVFTAGVGIEATCISSQ